MLILQLKQAEKALKGGRLDEAFELVCLPAIGEHRRGQELRDDLARAFLSRGQEHLESGCFQEALADAGKAKELVGNSPEVVALIAAVRHMLSERERARGLQGERLAMAREHIDKGWVSLGQAVLDEVGSCHEVTALKAKAVAIHQNGDTAAAKAMSALESGDVIGAAIMLDAAGICGHVGGRLGEVAAAVRVAVVEKLRNAAVSGRIDAVRSMLARVGSVFEDEGEITDVRRFVEHCQCAWEHVRAMRFRKAIEALRRGKSVFGGANWIDDAIVEAQRTADAVEALRGGPLGLLGDSMAQGSNDGHGDVTGVQAGVKEGDRIEIGVAADVGCGIGNRLPDSFLLSVDGVGSFLVFRGRCMTIGPISSAQRCDLPLVAEPSLAVATIERVDEDYFLRTDGQLSINGKMVHEKLLSDSDNIEFSHRCKMCFCLPNPASNTAVLDLSKARTARADMPGALLLDREIVLGPGGGAHVRMSRTPGDVVLSVQNGRMYYRGGDEVKVDNVVLGRGGSLPMNKPIRIGALSLVLRKLDTDSYTIKSGE